MDEHNDCLKSIPDGFMLTVFLAVAFVFIVLLAHKGNALEDRVKKLEALSAPAGEGGGK